MRRGATDRELRAWVAALAALLASGCVAPSAALTRSGGPGPVGASRILVMPADVQFYEVGNAGPRLHAEWTTAARRNLRAALDAYFERQGGDTQAYAPPDDARRSELHVQLAKLHRAVSRTIVDHTHRSPDESPNPLPTKQGLDWTLGEAARDLRDYTAADYALFLFVAGYAPSPKRVLAAAVYGATPASNEQASISLVDLRSGDLVWFSHEVIPLADRMSQAVLDVLPESWNQLGDLRRPGTSEKHIEFLLRGVPR